jgi:hypothetical protein
MSCALMLIGFATNWLSVRSGLPASTGAGGRLAVMPRPRFAPPGPAIGLPEINKRHLPSQFGSSVKMLPERYARWIPDADDGNARALLVAAMATNPREIRPNFDGIGPSEQFLLRSLCRKTHENQRLAWVS